MTAKTYISNSISKALCGSSGSNLPSLSSLSESDTPSGISSVVLTMCKGLGSIFLLRQRPALRVKISDTLRLAASASSCCAEELTKSSSFSSFDDEEDSSSGGGFIHSSKSRPSGRGTLRWAFGATGISSPANSKAISCIISIANVGMAVGWSWAAVSLLSAPIKSIL
ncbi:hypothetical protein FF38_13910 [Lucilia cuprina]|uniref:Uncharacterized protein n=1 Tax=Lucilia cuprina TaxID=7375 RepID=A0A0L0BMI3_LUCCU|nr:hypothetical protein FF38_13910 [Lucilia cuprina]